MFVTDWLMNSYTKYMHVHLCMHIHNKVIYTINSYTSYMNKYVCMCMIWRAIADTQGTCVRKKMGKYSNFKMYKPTDHKSRGQRH